VCEREGVLMCVLRYVTLRMIRLLKRSAVTAIQQKVFYYVCVSVELNGLKDSSDEKTAEELRNDGNTAEGVLMGVCIYVELESVLSCTHIHMRRCCNQCEYM